MTNFLLRVAGQYFHFRHSRAEEWAIGVLALVLGGCATTAPLSEQPPAGMPAAVAAPAISAGDTWNYRVRDGFTGLPRQDQLHRVVRVGGGRIEVAGNVERGDGSQVYDQEWNWVRRPATDLQTFEYSPAYQAYAFPLAPGKTWRAQATATDPVDGRRFPVRIEGKVLGWERVKVPAGEFDALKVERTVYIDYFVTATRGGSRIKEWEWYSPSVKWAVKREARAWFVSFTGNYVMSAPRFVPVREKSDGGGSRNLPDDWFVYELEKFKVR